MTDHHNTLKAGGVVINDKKFFVTIQTVSHSFEVPVYAKDLDEALDVAERRYMPSGLEVTRVRPANQ